MTDAPSTGSDFKTGRVLIILRRQLALVRMQKPKRGTMHFRTSIRFTAFVAATLAFVSAACAAPCISPISVCTEWLKLPQHPDRLLLYRSHELENKNDLITNGLIVIHGISRDADNYYRSALGAAFLAGAIDNTIIISPRFAADKGRTDDGRECHDELSQGEIDWLCGGQQQWKNGGSAPSLNDVTSFDVMDELMQSLARRDMFPNIRSVTLLGHSAGGQFVIRYAMANRVHEKVPFSLSYVVANPSSYPYLDKLRPTPAAMTSRYPALSPGYQPVPATYPKSLFAEFADAGGCTGYNRWPYGLEERAGYAASIADADLRRQLIARPITYLLGELDILPLYGFDSSCSAMAQGPTRLARGLAFTKYAADVLGAHHQQVLVPACGHNARCMFGSDVALPILFPAAPK